MTAQEGIEGGFAATYVPQDVAAARRREANQVMARKNLAAMCCDMYGIDPRRVRRRAQRRHLAVQLAARHFAELAAILGLDDSPERRPGTCTVCGADLPLVAAASSGGEYRRGLCRACTAARRERG